VLALEVRPEKYEVLMSVKAVTARERVLQHHRALNLMMHIAPFRRPDLDHMTVAQSPAR
jgi:hypothetical protein